MAPARTNQRSGFDRIRVSHSTEMSHRLHRSVLSIDVGTSGVRAALFDELGNQIEGAQAMRRRELADFVELDPEALVGEVIETIDELLSIQHVEPVEHIAISTFWH